MRTILWWTRFNILVRGNRHVRVSRTMLSICKDMSVFSSVRSSATWKIPPSLTYQWPSGLKSRALREHDLNPLLDPQKKDNYRPTIGNRTRSFNVNRSNRNPFYSISLQRYLYFKPTSIYSLHLTFNFCNVIYSGESIILYDIKKKLID